MNTEKFILTIVGSFIAFCSFSQDKDSTFIAPSPLLNLKASYNSSLIYPGARLGVEFPVMQFNPNIKKRCGRTKKIVKDRLISVNIGWYHHPYYHDNLYLTGGWTMRRTRPNGFFTEFSPEIGLSRTFVGGTTYKVDNYGKVSIVKFAGSFYPLCSVGGGIGYDFSLIKSKPFLVFYKLNLITMYPYNSTLYMRPAMELGIICRTSGFHLLKMNP